ncbi:Hypothetical_protein [Hexamita inflata]|uniref:Hypothetical_protein n=1 Tax=Hexamita inflata TaxID=28002 RepID=A0AA86THX2_9EUKA|nr:Hypothetical protein HINF_LOCUS5386 [Hexamita inflata]
MLNRHKLQLQQHSPFIQPSKNLIRKQSAQPKLNSCQSHQTLALPRHLPQIQELSFSIPALNLSETNSYSLESARIGIALKELNKSLGINEIPELIGQIKAKIVNLEFVHNRVTELLVLTNAHSQSIDLLKNQQVQIIARKLQFK